MSKKLQILLTILLIATLVIGIPAVAAQQIDMTAAEPPTAIQMINSESNLIVPAVMALTVMTILGYALTQMTNFQPNQKTLIPNLLILMVLAAFTLTGSPYTMMVFWLTLVTMALTFGSMVMAHKRWYPTRLQSKTSALTKFDMVMMWLYAPWREKNEMWKSLVSTIPIAAPDITAQTLA